MKPRVPPVDRKIPEYLQQSIGVFVHGISVGSGDLQDTAIWDHRRYASLIIRLQSCALGLCAYVLAAVARG